jgi:hypothetical protein
VSSCSAALFLSLKALGLPRDARVLIPAFTFAAVPSSVVHADCVPVLCEVGENYRIDMADFEAKLDGDARRSSSATCAAIPRTWTRSWRCASARHPGDRGRGAFAGHHLGRAQDRHDRAVGCFSFQSYKLVNAGEGGILITDDADLMARAVIMSGAYEHNWKQCGRPMPSCRRPLPAGRTSCRSTTCACRTCRPR